MLYEWNGKPVLMMPTLAYVVHKPGQGWARASAERLEREARGLSDREFWATFSSWDLPSFPVAFAGLDGKREQKAS